MTSATRKTVNVTLDALFDYSKIRPPPIPDDDDDDDVQMIAPPKTSTSGRLHTTTEPKVVEQNPVKVAEATKVVDDDWLDPPSTTMTGIHRVLSPDPAMIRIRQQKLELANIWQTSMRNIQEASNLREQVAESATLNHTDNGKRANDHEGISEEAPNKRQKILLKLQEQNGESHGVRICVDDKLDKLFTYYANSFGKRPKIDFVFRFDGQQLDGNKSPQDLDLEDEDIVEVHVKGARR